MERKGEYFVRRLIGEGGMGKVYEAEERLSRRRVALKVLRPELGRSEEGRRMFLNEMNILAHLDHPNIVRSLACTEVDGELVMALEYLEGETLRERLAARARLPWPHAVAIAAQVAAALVAAHGQEPPIVHRDLKPENLMIRGDRVVVMDFGIAKVLQAIRGATTHSVGTLQYMSPEQIDAADVDHRADIYCLGLILYEALAGRPPFQSESPRELLNLQCTAPAPALPAEVRSQLPRGVERVLARMLEKAPDARPQSSQEVLAALEPFVTGEGLGEAATPTVPSSESTLVGMAAMAAPGSMVGMAAMAGPAQGSMPTLGAAPVGAGGSGSMVGVGAMPVSGSMLGMAALPAVFPPARVSSVGAARLDTIALVERASRPREVSTRTGVAIALTLSLVAGLFTYAVRTHRASAGPAAQQTIASDGGPDADAGPPDGDAGADAGEARR
jgi:serine/threonine-protein kinase